MAVLLLALAGCAGSPPRPAPGVVAPAVWTEAWEYAGRPGRLIRTPSYRLLTTATDTELVASMPGFLEAALDRYTSAFGPLPRPTLRLDTFLMGDRQQWAVLTRQVMGADAPTYLRIERGGFASGGRALLWTIGTRDTLAIAAHEGWHQFTQRTFRQELPAWLEEGIAVSMEGVVQDAAEPGHAILLSWANPERFEQLQHASERGELIPLRALLRESPQDLIAQSTEGALTYYAQLWALLMYLREGEDGRYAAGLNRAVRDAAAGTLAKGDLVERYLNADIGELEQGYLGFVAQIITGGRIEAIERGLSPILHPAQSGIGPPPVGLSGEVRAGEGDTPK